MQPITTVLRVAGSAICDICTLELSLVLKCYIILQTLDTV